MKKYIKRICSLCLTAVMLLCAFGTGALAGESTLTSTIYLDPASGGGVKANDVSYSGGYVLSTTEGGRSYFQYDLSNLSIPEGEAITSAKWQFVASADVTGKLIQVTSYDYQSALGNQTETYQTLTEKEYLTATATEVRAFSPGLSEGERTGDWWQNKAEDTKAEAYATAFMNIDVTDALIKSIEGEKSYFNLMVWPASGYLNATANINNWTPYGGSNGVLVIETEKVASVVIRNKTEGKISAIENKEFKVSAKVTEGSSEISSVVLSVKDSNDDVQTYENPTVVNGIYTWNFSAGVLEGTYTATVTATYGDGTSITDTADIEVVGRIQEIVSKPHLLAKSDSGAVNFALNSQPSYFQHELPVLPEGAAVTSAKWYKAQRLGGEYTDANYIFYKFNAETKLTDSFDNSNVSGYEEITELTPFVTSDKVSEITVNGTFNDFTGDFSVVDITKAVQSAYVNGEANFGYMLKLSGGYDTVANYATEYRPFIIITYDMDPTIGNHIMNVENGVATASVNVYEGSAVLIIAAYSNDVLVDVVMEDELVGNKLSASLENTNENVIFKSYVWNNLGTMTPLLPILP